MDSIKAQDIIRHIFKDEDKGVAYVTGLSITDGVEVLTKVLPELIKKAQEKNNVNDEGYFNEIGNVYRRIIVDKLLNADHLWTIYCDSTGYPYMVCLLYTSCERIYFIGFFNIVLHPVSVRIDISETIAIIQHFLLIIHKTSC